MVRNVKFCICPTAQFNTQTPSQTLPLSHNAAACAQASIQLGDLFSLKMKVWLLLAETWQASAGTAIPTVMVQHDCGNRSANSIGLWDWEQSSWDWSAKCLCQFCMVFCAWIEKRSEQISSLWETQELLLILQFSEVVMNVLCEIAWGIIRDNSGFILKKRGELHQDDFSWTLAMLKSRLAPPLTTKASWSPPRGWSSRTSPCHPCSCHDGQPWQEPPQGTSRGWEKIFTWESLFNYFSNCFS